MHTQHLSVHRISKVEGYAQGYKNSSILEPETERITYLLRRIIWHHEEIADMKKELNCIAPNLEGEM